MADTDRENVLDETLETGTEETSTEGEESTEEIDYKAALEEERAARIKLEKDLSSIRGQVRSQRELEDLFLSELSGVNRKFDIVARGITHPDESEQTEQALNQIKTQDARARYERDINRVYSEMVDEVQELLTDENGEPLFENVESAPELEEFRKAWVAGKESQGSVAERKAMWLDAIGKAAKAARLKERQKLREAKAAEAKRPTKKAADEDDDTLDLDTGPSGSRHGRSLDGMDPLSLISEGLTRNKKKSKVFGN